MFRIRVACRRLAGCVAFASVCVNFLVYTFLLTLTMLNPIISFFENNADHLASENMIRINAVFHSFCKDMLITRKSKSASPGDATIIDQPTAPKTNPLHHRTTLRIPDQPTAPRSQTNPRHHRPILCTQITDQPTTPQTNPLHPDHRPTHDTTDQSSAPRSQTNPRHHRPILCTQITDQPTTPQTNPLHPDHRPTHDTTDQSSAPRSQTNPRHHRPILCTQINRLHHRTTH